jgi:hypothetical protein
LQIHQESRMKLGSGDQYRRRRSNTLQLPWPFSVALSTTYLLQLKGAANSIRRPASRELAMMSRGKMASTRHCRPSHGANDDRWLSASKMTNPQHIHKHRSSKSFRILSYRPRHGLPSNAAIRGRMIPRLEWTPWIGHGPLLNLSVVEVSNVLCSGDDFYISGVAMQESRYLLLYAIHKMVNASFGRLRFLCMSYTALLFAKNCP